MQQDLIDNNIENIKTAKLTTLIVGGFQIFLTRLPIIAAVIAIINLPVAIYYAFLSPELAIPFELIEATGEMIVDEVLLEKMYTAQMIDLGIWLYTLLGVLAVAFIVELTIHGEIPNLNSVISHAISRWYNGFRTGMIKILLFIGIFLLISIVGSIIIALFSAVLPMMTATLLASLFMLVLAIIPLILIVVFFFFDLYAASLRDVGGWQALQYSMRISNKKWLKIIGGLFYVFVAVRFPLVVFQLALGSTPIYEVPLFRVLMILILNILSAYSTVVYTLYFLHFDYSAEPVQESKTEK